MITHNNDAALTVVAQLDAFDDMRRQRDSARAWAVELEQRVDALLAITATMVALSEAKS